MNKGYETGVIKIDNIRPVVEAGLIPARGQTGFSQQISCRIFSHGTDVIRGQLKYRPPNEKSWKEIPMNPDKNDIFRALIKLERQGIYRFRIEAWFDDIMTWFQNFIKWMNSGEDITQDLESGIILLNGIKRKASKSESAKIDLFLNSIRGSNEITSINIDNINAISQKYAFKRSFTKSREFQINALQEHAYYGAWYEMFPRSQAPSEGKSGTFKDCIGRLPDVKEMGFNVIYFPPIHPIGKTSRRGKNGIIPSGKGDPGSPWAIGNASGGHKAINEDLGTMDDFRQLIKSASETGIEIALDIALQCSPDHPYVKEHPEWFYHRPDGSIRFAENPPKKYYDIYPLNFQCENYMELWKEIRSIFEFWIGVGIRIFRVDNPHTKPFNFWKWLIDGINNEHKDVVFLSEAFTKPSVMYELSKLGFHQSYTYFTWKNYDWEIREYFTELSNPEISSFFLPMLFTNTPDILPYVLQNGGRPAFVLRAALAATLSPLWGIYSGYELCENAAIPGKEEYLDSEKFQIKNRNWNAPGNIREFIGRLNEIRDSKKQLQRHGNVHFLHTDNPNIVAYTRTDPQLSSILIVVNINPNEIHSSTVETPEDWQASAEEFEVKDLITGESILWAKGQNTVKLVPDYRCAMILERQ